MTSAYPVVFTVADFSRCPAGGWGSTKERPRLTVTHPTESGDRPPSKAIAALGNGLPSMTSTMIPALGEAQNVLYDSSTDRVLSAVETTA